jgi:hypothetical protein
MSPGARSPFFAGAWAGAAPLLLWSLHFAFCYGIVAAGCAAILQAGALITPMQLRLVLAGGTMAALGLGGGLLLCACHAVRQGQGDLLPKVRLASALLALVGMLWTGLPLALLPVCRAAS